MPVELEAIDKRFDPGQPRDVRGRWSSGGGSGGTKLTPAQHAIIRQSFDRQDVRSVEELYERAKAGEPAFKETTEKLAEITGGTVHWQSVGSYPGTHLKGLDSSTRKLAAELDNDRTRLVDVMRTTLVYKTAEEARQGVAATIQAHGEENIVRIKDRHVNPVSGYRDILMNVRTPNGVIAEVQFNTSNLMAAKMGEGHRLYEQTRALGPSAPATTVMDLRAASMALYDTAYHADGNGNWGQ